MPGRPLSNTKKTQLAREERDSLMACAVQLYLDEKAKTDGTKPLSAKAACDQTSNSHFIETGKRIELAETTLLCWAKGGKSKAESNAEKGWLLPSEVDLVIEYAVEVANRGFPLSHRRLREHVNMICETRLGAAFPEAGVGKQWSHRFTEKHSKMLKTYWSRPLDTARSRAVNENTNNAWFTLLGDTKEATNVPDELVYGVDETSILPGGGTTQRVIGGRGKSVQHQQRSGDRENITVIPTICGDGSTTKPVIIFKGMAYQVKWAQENPLGASLGHQKKGYTDGEIGVEWIKDFNAQTHEKAAGRDRVLLVDGHNSHYTRGFLEYARANKIHVLCYPSHATHVYQGLDVVIFGPLKTFWTEERDNYERTTGQKVSKTNFLKIYAAAHIRAFTETNIRAAFRKTGVIPFDPAVVTKEMMAPSIETSCEGVLPLVPPTPIRFINNVFRELSRPQPDDTHQLPIMDARTELVRIAASAALHDLPETSVGFLYSGWPVQSTSQLPPLPTVLISPQKPHNTDLLAMTPTTDLERSLQQALHEANRRDMHRKDALAGLQSATILQGRYCETVRSQLAGDEEKKRGTKKGRLMGDGLPKLLTDANFMLKVAEHEANQMQVAQEKAAKEMARVVRNAQLEAWKVAKVLRAEENASIVAEWKLEVGLWEENRAVMKEAGKSRGWGKAPPRPQMVPPIPKPGVVEAVGENGEETDSSSGDNSDEE